MQPNTHYCQSIKTLPHDHVHRVYHDQIYGFPVEDDSVLFERLILEINQAGLSWTTILNKQQNFYKAYDGYEIKRIANYQEQNRVRLLNDTGIIRNRLKIEAAIYNAQVVLELQNSYGSFLNWLENHHPLSLEEWTKLFKKTFKFVGREIVHEFLMSIGFLEGAHLPICPVYSTVLALNPAWAHDISKDLMKGNV